MDLSKIKIANTRETIVENFLGVQLEIAREKNDAFKRKFNALTKPYNHQVQTGTLSEEKAAELLAFAMAGTVLVGWSNFKINDQVLEYSEENAKALLANDSDCRDFVIEASADFSRFLEDAEDESEKK